MLICLKYVCFEHAGEFMGDVAGSDGWVNGGEERSFFLSCPRRQMLLEYGKLQWCHGVSGWTKVQWDIQAILIPSHIYHCFVLLVLNQDFPLSLPTDPVKCWRCGSLWTRRTSRPWEVWRTPWLSMNLLLITRKLWPERSISQAARSVSVQLMFIK